MSIRESQRGFRLGQMLWNEDSKGSGALPGYFGSFTVHQDLIYSALHHNVISEVSFVTLADLSGNERYAGSMNIGSMRQVFGCDRVRIDQLDSRSSQGLSNTDLFLNAGYTPGRLCQERNLRALSFPICNLLHSLAFYGPEMFPSTIFSLLSQKENDIVICPSRAGQHALYELCGAAAEYARNFLGIRDLKPFVTHHIPFGIESSRYKRVDHKVAKSILGITPTSTCILYVGRLSEQSKADLGPLLTVFKSITENLKQVKLIIAGGDRPGLYTRRLSELVIRLGIEPNVTIYPNFDETTKPLLYSAADIFVSPVDNVQETHGLSLLEAMAMELPVVASDWSGYREIVTHGESGFLVPTYTWNSNLFGQDIGSTLSPRVVREYEAARRTIIDLKALKEGLEILIEHPELRREFGRSGRKRLNSCFTCDVLIKEYNDVWREQVEKSNAFADGRRPRKASYSPQRAFARFPSMILDGDSVLLLADDWQDKCSNALCGGQGTAEQVELVERITGLCRKEKVTLSYLKDKMPNVSADLLSHLLKWGVLEAVHT